PKPVTTAPIDELTRSSKNGFTPLPGTAIEGKQVAQYLQVPVYTEAQAVKSLLSSCKSPRLVHIATHGYFLKVEQPKLEDFARLSSNLHRAAIENPLTRSGLAFAGANAGILGKNLHPEAEDGLMTAQGVSGLDFTGTQLVVLSACETGLGNVQTGESVGGLRRSLILAGAEAVVMSLWSVPDVPTAILMERFYHYLLSEKKGRTIALETAQADLRYLTVGQMRDRWLTDGAIAQVQQYSEDSTRHLDDLRPKPDDYQPYSHPYYWSAFVCAGDASPMAAQEMVGDLCTP
ncbi:MAG: CHAT domain-containing protein, partial [Spirulinaceae cyanobacterium]